METISQTLPVDEGSAALVMAVGIVVERMGRLSDADRDDAYKLFKALRDAKTGEEIDDLRCALFEILDQEPVKAAPMKLDGERPSKLVKWAQHAGGQIKSLRERRGWSQTDLAAKAGLDQAHVSRIERAEVSPSRRTIEKVAAAFNVPVGYIDPSEE